MGILALPVLLVLLACALPGLGILGWGAWASTWRVSTAALGIGGAALAGAVTHLVPYALASGSEVNAFSLMAGEVMAGVALAAAGTVLAVPAVWRRRPWLGACSGTLFLAASLQPVLWFACNEWLSTAFGIVFTY